MKQTTDREEEIRITAENIKLLKKARQNCTCSGMKNHFHVLLYYDSVSGDEYFETRGARHRQFIERLKRRLAQLVSRRPRPGSRVAAKNPELIHNSTEQVASLLHPKLRDDLVGRVAHKK